MNIRFFTEYKYEYIHKRKQAGAELGQSQIQRGLGFTSVNLHKIDEQEILLTK